MMDKLSQSSQAGRQGACPTLANSSPTPSCWKGRLLLLLAEVSTINSQLNPAQAWAKGGKRSQLPGSQSAQPSVGAELSLKAMVCWHRGAALGTWDFDVLSDPLRRPLRTPSLVVRFFLCDLGPCFFPRRKVAGAAGAPVDFETQNPITHFLIVLDRL